MPDEYQNSTPKQIIGSDKSTITHMSKANTIIAVKSQKT